MPIFDHVNVCLSSDFLRNRNISGNVQCYNWVYGIED